MLIERPIVLFLCSRNSARSILAEAILRDLAGDRFEAVSAGLHADGVHPLTLRVLEEHGVSTEGLRSKELSEFMGHVTVKHAIIVCAKAAEQCPSIYPFALEALRWPFPDPAAVEGSEEERLAAFREVYGAIRARIEEWLGEGISEARDTVRSES